jgi:putative oxidoreductase
MAYGLLLIRVVVGTQMAAHGAQKMFGWFGGGGPRGTAGFFGNLRFRQPLAMASLSTTSASSPPRWVLRRPAPAASRSTV